MGSALASASARYSGKILCNLLSSHIFTETELINRGAVYQKAAEPWAVFTVHDERLISGQKPVSVGAVAELLIKALKKNMINRHPVLQTCSFAAYPWALMPRVRKEKLNNHALQNNFKHHSHRAHIDSVHSLYPCDPEGYCQAACVFLDYLGCNDVADFSGAT